MIMGLFDSFKRTKATRNSLDDSHPPEYFWLENR